MGLIIGVDGGGTKSTYLVYNTVDSQFSYFTGSSINYHSVGNDKACNAFREIILKIQNRCGEKTDAVYIGSAALGIGDNPDKNHPFMKCVSAVSDKICITSDLYIGLKGICSSPAIFLISGTGSMAIAEDSDGKLYSTGGWGYMLGDQGSGYYIGMRGIREAIKSYEGFIGSTSLIENVKTFFSIDRIEQLIEKVYNPPIERNVVARFAAQVINSAEKDDRIAFDIVKDAVSYLVKHVIVLHDKLLKKDTSLGLYGGCFQKSEYFYEEFKKILTGHRNNITVGFPKFHPNETALILAGEMINVKIPKDMILKARTVNNTSSHI